MSKRRLLWGMGSVGAVMAVGLAFAGSAWRDARAVQARRAQALADLEGGRWDQADASLRKVAADSRRLAGRLNSPIPKVVSFVPVLGRSVRTARTVLDVGAQASDVALEGLPVLRRESFWRNGRVDLAALRELRAFAARQRPVLERQLAAVRKTSSSPLVGPVGDARTELIERLSTAVRASGIAVRAIDLSERVLGAAGVRRYFIAFENPAEARGTGGLWANYGVLVADNGKLSLGRFGRVDEIARYATSKGPDWYYARWARFGAHKDWRQVPSGPDFPAVASIAEANVRKASGVGPVDGTIAIDPVGIAALLRITGPVSVAGWPQPIDAKNVVKATLHDAYSHFPDNAGRIAFLGNAAHAVWSRLVGAGMSTRAIASSGLGRAIDEKHLKLHFIRPDEQKLADALRATGALGDPARTVGVATNNMAGHKMDYWLKRRLAVTVDLHADGSASGDVAVTLRNDGPASGEPRYVIGPFDSRFKQGWNRQQLSLYLPGSASVGRSAHAAEIGREKGFVVVEWRVDLPPGGKVTRRVRFDLAEFWNPKGETVGLVIRKQSSLHPDDVSVRVAPPWGRRLIIPEENACTEQPTTTDIAMDARIDRWLPGWVVGPWARDVSCGN